MFLCKGGANLTRAKSGRISFLDVLSAVLPFSRGTARGLEQIKCNDELKISAIPERDVIRLR
jgi:hypothetical protein